jgi:serine/threonine-protein kinase HipA
MKPGYVRRRDFSILVYNYLIGNCDAYAKNFSILHEIEVVYARGGKLYTESKAGAVTLSPFYDLISTDVYESLSKEMAMKIGHACNIREVQKSDFYRVAEEINIKEKEMDRIIQSFSSIVENGRELMQKIVDIGFGASICEKIYKGIKDRLQKIAEK